MAATIQIIVAGILLLAWIWVLGRPLLSGGMGRGTYPSLDRSYLNRGDIGPDETFELPALGSEDHTSGPRSILPSSLRPRPPRFLRRWSHQPIARRRRQLMLASMFAAFAAFLLAVALRGRFIALFALMVVVLVIHLLVAARIGAKIVATRRAVTVAEAKRRVRPGAEGIRIRAPQVGGQPIEGAEELAALLHDDRHSADGVGITSFVSDLIDLEWGTETEEAAGAAAAETPPPAEPARSPASAAEPKTSSAPPAGETEPDAGSEPIFTRAAKDVPKGSRRKARPIYIESQLDETDGLPDARAVNHP